MCCCCCCCVRWPLLERLSEQRLVSLILELVRAMPGEERYECSGDCPATASIVEFLPPLDSHVVCNAVAPCYSRSLCASLLRPSSTDNLTTVPLHVHRYFSDICLYCLEVLQLITLSPLPRRDIIASSSSSSGPRGGSHPSSHQLRSGMAILLHAASTGNATPFYGLADPEV